MSYKTTDGLMRHLRDNGIAISGTSQKPTSYSPEQRKKLAYEVT